MLGTIVDYLRVRDWINVYLGNMVIALLLLALNGLDSRGTNAFLLFLVYQALVLIYIGIVNSLSDMESDRRAGRKLHIDFFPKNVTLAAIAFTVVTTVCIGFFSGPATFAVSILMVVLPLLYSMRPVRLKERGFLGIFVSAIGLGPLLTLFFALLTGTGAWALFFVVWSFARQLMLEAFHQQLHTDEDIRAGARTFATGIGKGHMNTVVLSLVLSFGVTTMWPALFFGHEGALVSTVLALFSLGTLAHIFSV